MSQSPLWKSLLIIGVCAAGALVAMPNVFYQRVETHNDAAKAVAEDGFATPEQQAALDMWPGWLPSGLIPLGLDLRGGAHLLAEVKLEDVYAARMDGMWPAVRDALRDKRDVIGGVRRQPSAPGTLKVTIAKPEAMAEALAAVQALANPVVTLTGAGSKDIEAVAEGDALIVQLSDAEKEATDARTMAQSLEIIRNRVDQAGTREPTIQRQGDNRILIQVPGIGSAAELKSLIGTTAKLTFNPVIRRSGAEDMNPGSGNVSLPSMDEDKVWYVVEETPVVSGEDLTNAKPDFDQNGRPAVAFQFDTSGARRFGDYTAQNIGSPFAIVLDNKVISAPTIQSHIAGGSGIITGNFTVDEANRLAVLLSAGALPADMEFLEERTIGPELGQDSIDAGKRAAVFGMIAVVVFMVASYGWFGMMANIALAINMVLLFAVLSLISATLTLPGIAGIVLTMGMAVDANVLIYERIREEIRMGRSPLAAIETGFDKAYSAIFDSNVTGMISAVIMYAVGSGSVRGFAVTMGLGIITSMFTAVNVTKLIVMTWLAWKRPKSIIV